MDDNKEGLVFWFWNTGNIPINSDSCQQNPNTETETPNTEKQEPPNRIETQSNCKQNTTHTNTTKQTITQEDKTNVETIKKIMPKNKTTLSSLSSQD